MQACHLDNVLLACMPPFILSFMTALIGYLEGLPLLSGIAVAADGDASLSEFGYMDTNLTSQLTLWSPGECTYTKCGCIYSHNLSIKV